MSLCLLFNDVEWSDGHLRLQVKETDGQQTGEALGCFPFCASFFQSNQVNKSSAESKMIIFGLFDFALRVCNRLLGSLLTVSLYLICFTQ